MKIGYFTDLHIRHDSPQGRLDNFYESIQKKLIEVGEIFKEQKVDLILLGGDVFDSPDVSNSVIYKTMDIFKQYPAPIIATIGSHDYFGYQMKSFHRTAVGLLHNAGIVRFIGNDAIGLDNDYHHLISEGDNNKIFRIVATHHTHWLSSKPEGYNIKKESDTYTQIQLTHGDLQDKPVIWDHTLIKEITTESDIVLGAHYHPGWDTQVRVINGKSVRFINPGAIGRLENTGVSRIPKVLIMDFAEANYTIQYVELQEAIKAPFKEKYVKEDESPMQDINKLLSLLENTDVKTINVKEEILQISNKLKTKESVLNKAFDCLEKAEEA